MNPNTELAVHIRHPSNGIFTGDQPSMMRHLEEETQKAVSAVGITALHHSASLLRGATPLIELSNVEDEQQARLFATLHSQLKNPLSGLADRLLGREEDKRSNHNLRDNLYAMLLGHFMTQGMDEYGRHYDMDFNVDPYQVSPSNLANSVDRTLRKTELITDRESIRKGKIRKLEPVGYWRNVPDKECYFGSEFGKENTATPGLQKVFFRTGEWLNEESDLAWLEDSFFLINADVNAEFYLVGNLPVDLRGRHGLSTDRMRWKVVDFDEMRDTLIVRPVIPTFTSAHIEDTTIRFPTTDNITGQLPIYLNLASRALVQSISFGFEIADPTAEMLPEITPELAVKAFKDNPGLNKQLVGRLRTGFHLNPKKATVIAHDLGLFKASPFLAELDEDQVADLISEMPDAKQHLEFIKMFGKNYNPFAILARKLSEYGIADLDGSLGWGLLTLLFHDEAGFEKLVRETFKAEKHTADEFMHYIGRGVRTWVQYLK